MASSDSAEIHLRYEQSGLKQGRAELSKATRKILTRCAEEFQFSGAEISVLYCSNHAIRALNRQYRRIDEPTDVLSFPFSESLDELRAMPNAYLGDLAISLPYVQKQAKGNKSTVEKDVALFLVHGFLHLVGYDHATKRDEKAMFAKQDELLALMPKFTMKLEINDR